MKLVRFTRGEGARLGLIHENSVIDLTRASDGHLPADMLTFLQQGEAALDLARQLEHSTPPDLALSEVKLLAPIANPSKVVAIGLNYMDHCREQKVEPPKAPLIFSKFSTAIIGPGEAIRWDPALTSQVDFEAELAVVIGRTARNVTEAEALDYVAGYTICHDVSARDLQFSDGQWVRGKSLDTFCPLGPYLVTTDEVPDPHGLAIRCMVNETVMQNSNTSEMIFRIPYLIAYITRAFTLLPGDVITTGTPDGVGVFRKPKIFLKDGDVVTIEIEGLGQLTNPCQEER
ncbi:MAG: fumarylacetoacetate hydrolase family protein [Anaerolineae bacterium]|nr:fumarylacetoacetate hydrolase family protein [Anaerolineae bacterium]